MQKQKLNKVNKWFFILNFVFLAVANKVGYTQSNFDGNSNLENLIIEKESSSIRISDYNTVLFNNDHTSEGFLAPLDDEKLILIFRIDPNVEGNHVGTDGYIASMTYNSAKDEWNDVKTVYNSYRYDDRNLHGGITKDGRLVVFLRRLDLIGDKRITEGNYFIYSNDYGESWSELQSSDVKGMWRENVGVWGTGQMFYNPDIEEYIQLGYGGSEYHQIDGKYRTEITYSQNGITWDRNSIIAEAEDTVLSEIAGAWAGNNRIVALIRDQKLERGHPLLQVESYDNGKTWTVPQKTNMPPDLHWGCAPQLIYDEKRDLLIALTSDRITRRYSEQRLYVYTARPNDIFGQPKNWSLEHEIIRPFARGGFEKDRPLNKHFYGYPTIGQITEDEYLVVFTERSTVQGGEQADLFYFRMIFKE